MRFLGLTIGEIATLIGLLGGGFSGIMFLFKSIIISPLNASIGVLQKSIDALTLQLDESKRDRQGIHQRINRLKQRVVVLEERDKWERDGKHE